MRRISEIAFSVRGGKSSVSPGERNKEERRKEKSIDTIEHREKSNRRKSMTDTRYTITATEGQIRTMQTALEVLARLGMGQFDEALRHLPLASKHEPIPHEDVANIARTLSPHMRKGVDGIASYLGILSPETPDEAKTAWDMHQVIRHRLAWDRAIKSGLIDADNPRRDIPSMIGVQYDAPYQVGSLPMIEIREDEKQGR